MLFRIFWLMSRWIYADSWPPTIVDKSVALLEADFDPYFFPTFQTSKGGKLYERKRVGVKSALKSSRNETVEISRINFAPKIIVFWGFSNPGDLMTNWSMETRLRGVISYVRGPPQSYILESLFSQRLTLFIINCDRLLRGCWGGCRCFPNPPPRHLHTPVNEKRFENFLLSSSNIYTSLR